MTRTIQKNSAPSRWLFAHVKNKRTNFHTDTDKKPSFALSLVQIGIRTMNFVSKNNTQAMINKFFCSPKCNYSKKNANFFLKKFNNGKINIDGFKIQTYKGGEGPVVVLIHGWNSLSSVSLSSLNGLLILAAVCELLPAFA